MNRDTIGALLAAILPLGLAPPGLAASHPDEAAMAEERLLGSADQEAQAQSYLPFTRQLGPSSNVTGSLADSTAAAGVPAAAMLEPLRALGTAIDLERDLHDGDRFYVRYEQAFTIEGRPIGVGRVLWLEVRTAAKGTIAVHRFRTLDGVEQFWLTNGQAAGPPPIRLPLDVVSVTSGFGLRADPLDQPSARAPVMEQAQPVKPAEPVVLKADPVEQAREERDIARAAAGFGSGSQLRDARDSWDAAGNAEIDRVMAERRARARRAQAQEKALRLQREAAAAKAAEPAVPAPPTQPPAPRKLYMHEGVDLLANTGTPVHAAADGVVIGAGPNGGYGNWIRIAHSARLTTVYGHLAGFAPGVEAGSLVERGDLIGFVGSTGRAVGAHLHFEVLIGRQPVNPLDDSVLHRRQLSGIDLARFRKQVAEALHERDREAASF